MLKILYLESQNTGMQIIDQFLEFLEVEKRYSLLTLKSYKADISELLIFCAIEKDEELNEISFQLLRAWIIHLRSNSISPRSINRKLSATRTFVNWIKLNHNVHAGHKINLIKSLKPAKRLPQFLQESEVKQELVASVLNDTFDGLRDLMTLEIFYQCGLRISEIVNLKLNDIHKDYIKVLGKRNKERLVPISDHLQQLIERYCNQRKIIVDSNNEKSELLLVQFNAKSVGIKFVYRRTKKILDIIANTEKKSPHVLRHTFATHLLNNGAGIEVIKNLLGHASLSATQVYTHNNFAQISTIYESAHPRSTKK